jgi:hypothetical protein
VDFWETSTSLGKDRLCPLTSFDGKPLGGIVIDMGARLGARVGRGRLLQHYTGRGKRPVFSP